MLLYKINKKKKKKELYYTNLFNILGLCTGLYGTSHVGVDL